jgi:hypothetical protein
MVQDAINLIVHLAGVPARWIVHGLGLPTSLEYSRYFIANLFVLTVLLYGWWAFRTWRKHRHLYFLFTYLFCLCLAATGFLATILLPYAWLYATISIIAGFTYLFRLYRRRPHAGAEKRVLRRFLFISLIIALAVPVTFSIRQDRRQTGLFQEADRTLSHSEQALNEKLGLAESTVDLLAGNDGYRQMLKHRQSDELLTLTQLWQVEQKLDFIITTDPLANVLARSHQPKRHSDNLFEQITWTIPLYQKGETVKGYGYDESGRPVLVAGKLVKDGNLALGVILTGWYVNQDLIRSCVPDGGNLAVVQKLGMSSAWATADSPERLLYSLAEVSNALRERIRYKQSAFYLTIETSERHYVLSGRALPTLSRQQPLWLVSTLPDPEQHYFLIIDLLAVVAAGILLTLTLSYGKRTVLSLFRRRNTSPGNTQPESPASPELDTLPDLEKRHV